MSKVCIGLRGWRFDEAEVFDEDGEFRSLDDLPEDTRQRLIRLVALHDSACDACWLIHGDENVEQCNRATVVYGEPMAEVTLCDEHETDFYFWYRERGGSDHRGTEAFQERFHEWFAGGGRAPEGYTGVEHVDTEPEALPDPVVPEDGILSVEIPEEEKKRIDLEDPELVAEVYGEEAAAAITRQREQQEGHGERDGDDQDDRDEELDLDSVDLDADYPS